MKKSADQGVPNSMANLGVQYLQDGKTEEGEKLQG